MEEEEVRVNGCGCPFHPFQILSYIMFSIKIVSFLLIIPIGLMHSVIAVTVLFVLYILSVTMIIYYTARATAIDPTDPTVYLERNIKANNESFMSADYQYYCQICRTHVQERTKHCGDCNRCVSMFDHHCKWLNNCIGDRNYRHFIYLCICVFCMSIIQIISHIYCIQQYYQSSTEDNLQDIYGSSMAYTFLIVVFIVSGLNVITLALISHLIGLHVWLHSKGLTTYDYILILRERKDGRLQKKSKTVNKIDVENDLELANMRNKSDIPLENEQNITDTSNSKQGKSKGRFCGLCRGGDKREQRVEGKSKSQEEEATSNKEKPPTDNKERSEINPSSSKHKLEEYAASAAQLMNNIAGCNATENITSPQLERLSSSEITNLRIGKVNSNPHNSRKIRANQHFNLYKHSTIMAPNPLAPVKARLNRSDIISTLEEDKHKMEEIVGDNRVYIIKRSTSSQKESNGETKLLETLNKLELKKSIETNDQNAQDFVAEGATEDPKLNIRKMIQGYNTFDYSSGTWVRTPARSPSVGGARHSKTILPSLNPNPSDIRMREERIRELIQSKKSIGKHTPTPDCIEIDDLEEIGESHREDSSDFAASPTTHPTNLVENDAEIFESEYGDDNKI